ncbi:DNA-(apurinic or apyrimidinic site) lyase /endonuclease III [Hymenobacter gelipurpurascens]|uniref:Endonuclease III n=1 Tax=Hymenobacter gelipurpurascens TaxID=89968 RepID=A0A212UHC6_9BACT|nr:endonuclease III [Hymenobacter gelipurpurascens]SNC77474.1 DNA-(apurinic or apyrimidinic site) lyase /endonuclease III [Hymenobacter gelipurpurascens]
MRKPERFRHFLEYFTQNFPEPETELVYSNPYELIVAVVLSAQCTDKRVNQIMPTLLEQFPTPEHLAAATPEEVFPFIRSVSYPNNKAKHLSGLGRLLVSDFGGEVPSTIEELQRLPGVGRKTANVVVSVIYNQPAMAVDTHVFRVSHRLGLVSRTATTPLAVEKELVRYIPEALIPKAHHWLILHGRYICVARQPKCAICPLKDWCKYYADVVAKTAKLAPKALPAVTDTDLPKSKSTT